MASLPTFERLGTSPPKQVDAEAVGRTWTSTLSQHLSTRNVGGVMSLLHDDSWWRDLYAMTWDLRTFEGRPKIKTFLHDRLDEAGISAVSFRSAQFQQVYHDMAWTTVDFSFETRIGIGRGVSRLVYTKDGSWKAVIVCTILDGLKGHPELPRDQSDTHLDWDNERRKEQVFADRDPEVLIIGSGHAGLAVAARLKHLGVSHLILEKNERVGDNWRNRYDSLSLHSLTWAIHFPYLPFPASWPAVIPAKKFANWLESYVEIFELNVWTSSTATHASRDDATGRWAVSVKREDGSERVMHVDHVVLAYGYPWKDSTWPGQDEFRGQILHSSQYRNAEGFRGKKVVVIGACTSGHDVARDCARLGVDVTLFQRSSTYVVSVNKGVRRIQPQHIWESGTPIEDIDVNFGHSIPNAFHKLMQNREEPDVLELDKDILKPLREVGYRVRRFPDGPGILFLSLGGGYYLDTGACKYIIEGKIKLKNDAQISRFERDGIRFDDDSKLEADVIVVATGFTDNRVAASRLIGEELGSQLPPIWGINEEYEVNSVWRDLAPVAPNLWPMLGTIDWVRYYSKHVALQIKAKQVGLYGTRYAASDVPQKARL